MKKFAFLFLILILFTTGCSSSKEETSKENLDIKGYWLQVEDDSSGKVTDLTNNKYAYFKVTDDQLLFYSYYADTNSHTVSEKYYKLEGNELYYDYYELKGDNWKENINKAYGGKYIIEIKDNKLILTTYKNGKNKDEGYNKMTYKKISLDDWVIEE